MGAFTSFLNLYKPGGGSTGLILPDEVADIDKLNLNFDAIDDFAAAWGLRSSFTPTPELVSTFGTGWSSPAGTRALEVQRIGNRVFIQGSVTAGTGHTSTDVCTVPSAYAPGGSVGILPLNMAYGPNASGRIVVFSIDQTGKIALDRVSGSLTIGDSFTVNASWRIN